MLAHESGEQEDLNINMTVSSGQGTYLQRRPSQPPFSYDVAIQSVISAPQSVTNVHPTCVAMAARRWHLATTRFLHCPPSTDLVSILPSFEDAPLSVSLSFVAKSSNSTTTSRLSSSL